MTRGYMTIATGRRDFIELAVNLALSVKKFDPEKPIGLMHDKSIEYLPSSLRGLFDHFADTRDFPEKDQITTLNKLLLFRASPFDETIFMDADCLVVKSDMDRHWDKMAAQPFNIAGAKMSSGEWRGLDIGVVCEALGVDYIVQMNGGVIFFNKSDEAKAVFDAGGRLFQERKDVLTVIRKNYNNTYADEPVMAAAMGVNKIEPASYSPEEGSIMITTLHARNIAFDLSTETARIDKPAGFWIANRLLAKKWVRHSPTIAHFIKLRPKKVYQALSDELRREAGAPLYDFSGFT